MAHETNLILYNIDRHDNFKLVFDFADGGSLREHLANNFDSLTWKDKYKLGLEITNGIKYLHELDIIHKNLVFKTFVLCFVCVTMRMIIY